MVSPTNGESADGWVASRNPSILSAAQTCLASNHHAKSHPEIHWFVAALLSFFSLLTKCKSREQPHECSSDDCNCDSNDLTP